ncbi:MAG: 5-(carboxyamino)imidazole ribonucleotide mutase [Planctomycetota bacterium]|jgi:phosphoribosylaminoimidazole carboxylase PurE protein
MSESPRIVIVMGSDSDLAVVERAVEVLERLGIAFELRVLSAHRSPEAVEQLAGEAESRGVEGVIAAAGGAAHLAGVLAARTTLPVIGVPVPTDRMGGMDSLLSTVQMPAGVPVACMGLGKSGAQNAAFLAAQILATHDASLREALARHKEELAERVQAQDARVQQWLRARAQD